jgi:copper chaperone CopZ
MSCESCEAEVNNEIAKVNGVLTYQTSYATHSSVVSFDKSKVDVKAIDAAISNSGYKVKGYEYVNVLSIKNGKEKLSIDSLESCCEKKK